MMHSCSAWTQLLTFPRVAFGGKHLAIWGCRGRCLPHAASLVEGAKAQLCAVPSPLPVHTAWSSAHKPGATWEVPGISRTGRQMNEGGVLLESIRYENTQHTSCSLGHLGWEAAKSVGLVLFCFLRKYVIKQFEKNVFFALLLTWPFPAWRGHIASMRRWPPSPGSAVCQGPSSQVAEALSQRGPVGGGKVGTLLPRPCGLGVLAVEL